MDISELWDGNYVLGLILEKYDSLKSVKVLCLEKPYGVKTPQVLEKEYNAGVYEEWQLYKAPVQPAFIKCLRTWKYIY